MKRHYLPINFFPSYVVFILYLQDINLYADVEFCLLPGTKTSQPNKYQVQNLLFLYRSENLVSLYFNFYYICFLSGSTFIAPVKCIWCWEYFLIYTLWNWIFFVCFSEFRPDRFLRMHNYFLYVLFSRSVLQMNIRNFPLVLMIWDCVMKDLLLLGR